MITGVIDSTVIVHLFRGNDAAHNWFESLTTPIGVTPITWLEIFFGASGRAAMVKCRTLMLQFTMEHQTPTDLDWTVQQMEQLRLSNGVSINDCLIASVCQRMQLPLYTHNVKHMNVLLGPDLVVKPY